MADERKIVIVLKAENDTNAQEEKVSTGTEENTKQTKGQIAVAVVAWAVKELLSTAASEALNWAMFEVDKNLMLKDDYIGQRNKRIALQCINRTASNINTIYGSTASGAALGGAGGAIVGFLVGTAHVVSSTVRENVQNNFMQNVQLAQMNAQLSYTRQRSGWSTNAASIGEDL